MFSWILAFALFFLLLAGCAWSRRCDRIAHEREQERLRYLDSQHLSEVDQQ